MVIVMEIIVVVMVIVVMIMLNTVMIIVIMTMIIVITVLTAMIMIAIMVVIVLFTMILVLRYWFYDLSIAHTRANARAKLGKMIITRALPWAKLHFDLPQFSPRVNTRAKTMAN